MSGTVGLLRPTILAHPISEHTWRVCSSRSGGTDFDQTVGYIGELGGTYEVRVLQQPALRRYVSSFKEAMEFFHNDDRAG